MLVVIPAILEYLRELLWRSAICGSVGRYDNFAKFHGNPFMVTIVFFSRYVLRLQTGFTQFEHFNTMGVQRAITSDRNTL